MLAKVFSVALVGVDALLVTVEVDVSPGMPAFNIVGLPDQAVSEARERVRAAIKNSSLPFPAARITVNLAPADLRKEGVMFDLPIALGILATQHIIPAEKLLPYVIAGELALDGSVRPVSGMINLSLLAAQKNLKALVPEPNANEAAMIEQSEVYAPSTLLLAVGHLAGNFPLQPVPTPEVVPSEQSLLCLSDIKGQTQAKRALEVAIAGGHNLYMLGSPGSGKTMLARRAVSLLPPLTKPEALEVTRIHSAAGQLGKKGLIVSAPFRAPHHTVSEAGLVGGGSIPKPGEVSLAHHGILFLDEFLEFNRKSLEALRQPLEDAMITISRARSSITYPAKLQLIAAANPCPCGYYGDPEKPCTCSLGERMRYIARVSGPLLDRIDLVVNVPRLTVEELTRTPEGEASDRVRERIMAARERMYARQGFKNSVLQGTALREHTALKPVAEQFIRAAAKQLGLTGRGFDRVMRVARTIADLAASPEVNEIHLAEAIAYRPRTVG